MNDTYFFHVCVNLQISAIQNTEPGWLAGELKGKTGWFPESYVETIEDSSVPTDSIKEVIISNSGGDLSLELIYLKYLDFHLLLFGKHFFVTIDIGIGTSLKYRKMYQNLVQRLKTLVFQS